MRTLVACFAFAAALGAAACSSNPGAKTLPSDLPPPEYEKPRGFEGAAPDAGAPLIVPSPNPPPPAPKP
jgi:hypothetical protein